jgi:cytochrome c2
MSLVSSLTRTRAAACSIMLVSAGVLAMAAPAYTQGDAAAGEKVFAHCAPCHSNKPGENKFGPYWLVCSTGFRGAEGSSGGPIAVRT